MSEDRSTQKPLSDEQIRSVLPAFFGSIEDCQWSAIKQGNINDTFLASSKQKSLIVQCINGEVFPFPEGVAVNSALVSAHIRAVQSAATNVIFPEIVTTVDGENYYKDGQGRVWRAQKYIKNTKAYEKLKSHGQAFEIGKCLGQFHRIVQNLPPADLTATLPDFHNLPKYFSSFNSSWSTYSQSSSDELLFCVECISENRQNINFFRDAVQRGDLQVAVTHGDPKVSNVLFDMKSDRALTLIDLDTVGPGLILQDIGDCLRSCCCRKGENEFDSRIECEPELVAQAFAGYLQENELSTFEKENIYTALHLITFELGVRFLTDFLEGNRYFKVQNGDDNLWRAVIQFRLVKSIEAQQENLCSMISNIVQQLK